MKDMSEYCLFGALFAAVRIRRKDRQPRFLCFSLRTKIPILVQFQSLQAKIQKKIRTWPFFLLFKTQDRRGKLSQECRENDILMSCRIGTANVSERND